MKKLFPFFSILLFCCDTENSGLAVLPESYDDEPEWIVYEGIIPLKSGEEITMELSLKPGSPGIEGDYQLNEWNADHNMYMMGRSGGGKYTTLIGATPNEVNIQLHETRLQHELYFGKLTEEQAKQIAKANKHRSELYFKTNGNELVLADENFREIEPKRYSLIRRSKTFTVEGYITFVNDTSEFFEMNTRETWALVDRAMFGKAKSNYFAVAKEKYEGVYLRGLGYSVEYQSPAGKNIDALVLRNIYEMHPGKNIKP